MADVMLLTLDQSEAWAGYLSRLPLGQQDVYFTPEYYRLHESKGDGRAMCYVYEEEGNLALYPFLLNRINDLGYKLDGEYFDIQGAYGYNGAVASSSEPGFRDRFFSEFGDFRRHWRIVTEFTRFHPLLHNHAFHENRLEVVEDRTTVVLDLASGYDDVFRNQYDSRNRNMVRKALKSGLEYKTLSSAKAFELFADVYYASMKRISADPEYYFPREYFTAMAKTMKEGSFVVCAFEKGALAAASLFLIRGLYCHYHLSGRADSCSDNSASNFILDVAIREAIDRGAKWLHLGGGRTNAPDDSLLRFKQGFAKGGGDFRIGKAVHLPAVYDLINLQWKQKHPQAAGRYSGRLQGYRILV
jgi:hypothetical protein